jgi:hypothetical protein
MRGGATGAGSECSNSQRLLRHSLIFAAFARTLPRVSLGGV